MHVILDQNLVRATGRQDEEHSYAICILHGALRTWERDLKISTKSSRVQFIFQRKERLPFPSWRYHRVTHILRVLS